jgi:hypothetical protein
LSRATRGLRIAEISGDNVVKALWLAIVLLLQGAAPGQNSLPVTGVGVSGRVNADQATSGRVIRVAMSSTTAAEVLSTIVDSDGSFEFSKVLPGSYTVFAFAATSISTSVTLTVGTVDVTNLTIRLPAPKEVRGRITVQGNLPVTVPLPRLTFSLAPIAGIPASSASLPADLQPDGSFKIALPQGERGITVVAGTIPPGYKLASFTYGMTDLLKNPLRVNATDSAELRVILDATSITPVNVSGRVTGLLTTQGVRVVLTNSVFGSVEATVNSDGSFAFSKVIPGNYIARLSLSGLSASRQIAVGNRDVTDVIIVYPREFVVTGHIIVEGGVTSGSPQIVLEAKSAAGMTRTSNIVNREVIMLNLKDGEYNFSVRSLPSGYQLKSITYGTTDLQKELLKIDGPVTWEIIVRLIPTSPTAR